MAWKYVQKTGHLYHDDRYVTTGYSGYMSGLDNPAEEQVKDTGPLPAGEYIIGRFFDDLGGKGPKVAHLVPSSTTDTFGRDGFMLHGDSPSMNRTASHGCIILNRPTRDLILASADRTLIVTHS